MFSGSGAFRRPRDLASAFESTTSSPLIRDANSVGFIPKKVAAPLATLPFATKCEHVGIVVTRIGLVIVPVWIGSLKAFRNEDEGIVPVAAPANCEWHERKERFFSRTDLDRCSLYSA